MSLGAPPVWLICIAAAGKIEVFFKQIKQSLQLCDFLGNSANAVRWQVWTALLLYVLLYVLMRFLCVMSSWSHSFTRLFTLLRAPLWRKDKIRSAVVHCFRIPSQVV